MHKIEKLKNHTIYQNQITLILIQMEKQIPQKMMPNCSTFYPMKLISSRAGMAINRSQNQIQENNKTNKLYQNKT